MEKDGQPLATSDHSSLRLFSLSRPPLGGGTCEKERKKEEKVAVAAARGWLVSFLLFLRTPLPTPATERNQGKKGCWARDEPFFRLSLGSSPRVVVDERQRKGDEKEMSFLRQDDSYFLLLRLSRHFHEMNSLRRRKCLGTRRRGLRSLSHGGRKVK